MPRRLRRILLPLSLLAFGVCLLEGCLYIPTFNATIGGKDAAKLVGPGKALQTGASTRDRVRQLLGQPFSETTDGRFLVYSWLKRKGILVYPICFIAYPEDRSFAMTLEFDARGIMTDFQLEEGYRTGYLFSPASSRQFVPTRVMIHQQELRLQRRPDLLEQFRASTRRSVVIPPKASP